MIREDSSIHGIPIPGPDGELAPAPAATRLAPQEHTLKERGLVDDTMIALASSASIPSSPRVSGSSCFRWLPSFVGAPFSPRMSQSAVGARTSVHLFLSVHV